MKQNKLTCCAGVPTLMIEFISKTLPDDFRHAGQKVREGRRGQQLRKEASRMQQHMRMFLFKDCTVRCVLTLVYVSVLHCKTAYQKRQPGCNEEGSGEWHVSLSMIVVVSISGLTSERESTRVREDVAIYNLPMSVCVC